MEDRWLTVDEVAERLSLHPETVRDWLRRGRLPGTLLSRRAGWRVRESDVRALLEGTGSAGAPKRETPADSDERSS